MSEFVRDPTRDASSAWRGYVFQAVVTVQRWLELAPDEQLQLEWGEDIDAIRSVAAGADQAEFDRTLEQVSTLDRHVTLRDTKVVGSLAQHFLHATRNPRLRLRFRFSSTAVPGIERGETESLIEQLQAVVSGTVTGRAAVLVAQRAAKTVLSVKARPDGVRRAEWKAFRESLRSASGPHLVQFFSSFDWSLGLQDLANLRASLGHHLRVRLPQLTDADETVVLDQLVGFLALRVMVAPPPRLLSADLLDQVVRDRPVSSLEIRSARRLLDALEGRVAQLEATVAQHTTRLSSSELQVERLAEQIDIVLRRNLQSGVTQEPQLSAHAQLDLATPPDLPSPLFPRAALVSAITKRLSAHGLCVLTAPIGSGKATLCNLATRARAGSTMWVRLPPEPTALVALLVALCESSPPAPPPSSATSNSPADAGSQPYLVLLDLPRFQAHEPETALLRRVIESRRSAGTSVLLTSAFALPGSLLSELNEEPLALEPLSEGEVSAFLAEIPGVPAKHLEFCARLVSTVSQGHAALARAQVRLLAERRWEPMAALSDLVSPSAPYRTQVSTEALQWLLRSISKVGRDLLYRLSTVSGAFDADTVDTLGQIAPAVPRPREVLGELRGTCLDVHPDGSTSVVPVFAGAARTQLPDDLNRECARRLGLRALSRDPYDQSAAASAILYFVTAGEVDQAVLLLASALGALARAPKSVPSAQLTAMWSSKGAPLPAGVSPLLVLHLRAQQILARQHRGEKIDDQAELLIGAYDALPADSPIEWRLAAAPSLHILASAVPGEAVRIATDIVLTCKAWPQWPNPERDLPPLETLLWFTTRHLNSDDALAWLRTIQQLPDDGLRRLLSGDYAHLGLDLLLETAFAGGSPNRSELIAALNDAGQGSLAAAHPSVAAALARRQIALFSVSPFDLESARTVASAALALPGLSLEDRFLVLRALGLGETVGGDFQMAVKTLRAALADPCGLPDGHEATGRHNLAASLLALGEPREALQELALAEDVLTREAGRSERARINGTRVLCRIALGELPAGVHALARAADIILGDGDDTEVNRDCLKRLREAARLIQVKLGEAADAASDRPDLFVLCSPEVAERCQASDRALLATMIRYLSLRLNVTDLQEPWLQRAVEECVTTGTLEALALVAPDYFTRLALAGQAGNMAAFATILQPVRHSGAPPARSPASLAIDLALLAVAVLFIGSRLDGAPDAASSVIECLSGLRKSASPFVQSMADRIDDVRHDRLEFTELWQSAWSSELPTEVVIANSLLLALHSDARAEHVFLGQTQVCTVLCSVGAPGDFERDLLRPELFRYWTARFARERFRFRAPNVVARALDEATELQAPRDAIRALFAAVEAGLQPMRVHDEVRAWLDGHHRGGRT